MLVGLRGRSIVKRTAVKLFLTPLCCLCRARQVTAWLQIRATCLDIQSTAPGKQNAASFLFMYAGVHCIMAYRTAGHGCSTRPFHQSLMYSFRAASKSHLQIAVGWGKAVWGAAEEQRVSKHCLSDQKAGQDASGGSGAHAIQKMCAARLIFITKPLLHDV